AWTSTSWRRYPRGHRRRRLLRRTVLLPVCISLVSVRVLVPRSLLLRHLLLRQQCVPAAAGDATPDRGVRGRSLRGRRRQLRRHVPAPARGTGRARAATVPRRTQVGDTAHLRAATRHVSREVHDGAARTW